MVESAEEYVLQWDAHAKYVTERFSGLFARQALVDVTLICDEQKLRVHKLVLASCSLYFEEMLQQDLGQEPVIFLDLNFEILKAMVEFMYCGETTIAHQFLPSLLEAAENFKVKELACMVEKTIRPQEEDSIECEYFGDRELSEDEMCAMGCMTRILENEIRSDSETNNNNHHTIYETKDITESDSEKENMSTEMDDDSEEELSNTLLYESSSEICETINNNTLILSEEQLKRESKSSNSPSRNIVITESLDEMIQVNDDKHEDDNKSSDNLGQMSYEQCCDILTSDLSDHRVGQCLRVYTHKKRENAIKMTINTNINQPPTANPDSSSSGIDLLDESRNSNTPVTLQSSLNTDCLDNYSLLNDESATTIEEAIVSDDDEFGRLKSSNESHTSDSNPSFSGSEKSSSLRRSVRLSQQDCHYKKTTRKRKCTKDREHRVPDLCNGNAGKRNCRRREEKNKSKRKEENKMTNGDGGFSTPSKCMVTTSIDRALWGDMSDVRDLEQQEDLLGYCDEVDAQIPFAVGLLPLRAALERMQAMPEHQPRKTRSSVAPSKNDSAYSRRRFFVQRMDLNRRSDSAKVNANALCHVQINAYKNRKPSSNDDDNNDDNKSNDAGCLERNSTMNKCR